MRIDNYKYNESSFETDAYKLMIKRDLADEELKKQETIVKKLNKTSLAYYKAYLKYLHDSNEHMASFLPFLKHEYEMLKKQTVISFNDDEMLNVLNGLITKVKAAFDFYINLYDELKKVEYDLKETIETFEANKFAEDTINLWTIHQVLDKLSMQDLILQNTAETYRDNIAFPLVEESLKTRMKGEKFETYQERSKKIVEESALEA